MRAKRMKSKSMRERPPHRRHQPAYALPLAISLLAGSLGLAGCASLPTSGAPTEFALETPAVTPITQSALGPQEGSTPIQLVSDFLSACAASADGDYATAREYLTEEAAQIWDPSQGVIIYQTDDTPSMEETSQTETTETIMMEPVVQATVNENGVYTYQGGDEQTVLQFNLELNEGGQWRISALPDGLILSEASFTSNYESANLYFVSLDEQALVADLRWYSRSAEASYLVEALLAGPCSTLEGVVSTYGRAENLTLSSRGVEIVDGQATVALTGNVSSDVDERKLLAWQIEQTLLQMDEIDEVAVTLNAVEIDSYRAGAAFQEDSFVAIASGQLVVGQASSASARGSWAVANDAATPAIGPVSGSPVAWVEGDEVVIQPLPAGFLARENEEAEEEQTQTSVDSAAAYRLAARDVTSLSVDRAGLVWAVSGGSEILVADTTAAQGGAAGDGGEANEAVGGFAAVTNPVSGMTRVEKVVLSPDGAYAAILGETSSGTQLWLATVERGDAVTLSNSQLLAAAGDFVADFSWLEDAQLLVLTGEATGSSARLLQVSIDGVATVQYSSTPAGSTRVAAAAGEVFLQTSNQTLYRSSGTVWMSLGDNWADFAVPN